MLLSLTVAVCTGSAARGQTVFSNDFESDTAGFTPSGSLAALSRASLPTDSGGLASPNQSTWLGKLGSNLPKSGSLDESVALVVTGLTPGKLYSVAFDLFIGASWDGSASSPYGPDSWRFVVDGVPLVNTTFTNGNQGQEYGAYSPQRYSDLTYSSLIGTDFSKFTGADASFTTGGTNYGEHYGIYRFGRGDGNPTLTFVAIGQTSFLEFARFGNTTDSGDEYWALDNVRVSVAIPEPASLCLLITGVVSFVSLRRGGHRIGPRRIALSKRAYGSFGS
ncbi:hypothetical protein [Lacipirellula sp.]|uniref:hypothetical protein n=1 Tax=Lacipirellula sp. TaxID=2691419 RepID=UPI003D0DC9A5